MEVQECEDGNWEIGDGMCVYESEEEAEEALIEMMADAMGVDREEVKKMRDQMKNQEPVEPVGPPMGEPEDLEVE